MKKKILGITKTYKKEIELSELDLRLYDSIHKDWHDDDYDVDNRIRIRVTRKGDWEGEAIPVNIDDAIGVLNNLKKAGSNYAEIMYHSDHNGYVFNGVEIRQSTEEEISGFLEKQKKAKGIQKEIAELQKEFEKKNKLIEKLEE